MNSEQHKYLQLYERQLHEVDGPYADYGHTNHGRHAYDLLPPGTRFVLDVGCGYNEFVRGLPDDIEGFGIDFACPGADWIGPLDVAARNWLQKPPWEIDVITAFDVLEHVPEPELETFLTHIRQLCPTGTFICSISHVPSKFKAPDGSTLHPTVRPPEWWRQQLLAHWDDVERIGRYWRCA